jgi:hypothetical protein
MNPVNLLYFEHINRSTSRRQGHLREELSEGSPSAKLRDKPVPDLIRETEMAYKAQSPGKSARLNFTQDSGDRVNAAVVQ